MAERTCVICASTFTAKGGVAVTCGNPDCQRLRRNERMREFFRRHKEATGEAYTQRYREKRNAHARATSARYRKFNDEEQLCERCARPFRSRSDQAYRFCSRSCASRRSKPLLLPVLHPAPSLLAWLPAKHPAMQPQSRRKQRLFVAGSCVRCSAGFVVVDQTESRYCSLSCARSDGKARRRALKRGAFVAPVYRAQVFERDGWRCQICKKKVRHNAVAPHPLAPVLDHITPLADGGTHEPANVQCAHFQCNSIKSDGAANDQLRLIG